MQRGLLFITLHFIVSYLVALNECNAIRITSPEDPDVVKISKHILQAYRKNPNRVNKCSLENHSDAIRMHTRNVTKQAQDVMIREIQTLIIDELNVYFLGLEETLSALRATEISYIFYWDNLKINSITYRDPLSGKKLTLHSAFSPVHTILENYTHPKTGQNMIFESCKPFPMWYSNYYKHYVPGLIRLVFGGETNLQSNIFLTMSNGIGGRFNRILRNIDQSLIADLYDNIPRLSPIKPINTHID